MFYDFLNPTPNPEHLDISSVLLVHTALLNMIVNKPFTEYLIISLR